MADSSPRSESANDPGKHAPDLEDANDFIKKEPSDEHIENEGVTELTEESEPSEQNKKRDPSGFIQSFKNKLDEVRDWKQAALDKLADRALMIQNAHGKLSDQDYTAMETLEADIEAVEERRRKLDKVYGSYNSQTGEWGFNRVLDEETKTWSEDDWDELLTRLEVHDGFVWGRKKEIGQESDAAVSTADLAEEKHDRAMTETGPTENQLLEHAQIFVADQVEANNDLSQGYDGIESQQIQDSGLDASLSTTSYEEPVIPDSWMVPGAWSNALDPSWMMEETEGNLPGGLTPVPEPGQSELAASPQASSYTSESSDNLFVGPHKEKRAHAGSSRTANPLPAADPLRAAAPSPPSRKTQGSVASSGYMRELFDANSDSMVLPGAESGVAAPAIAPADRAHRETEFLTARPNTKGIVLLKEQGIEAPLPPKKRAADAEVDGALGAFVSPKPAKKKAKKGNGEEDGGEKSPAPVRWPGQTRR